jgi:hypothetical protein
MSFVLFNHAPDGTRSSAYRTATATAALTALAAMLDRSADDWSWRNAPLAIAPRSRMNCAPPLMPTSAA